MRVLILGGTGMLGHIVYKVLKSDLDVFVSIRGNFSVVKKFVFFDKDKTICGLDVEDFPVLEKIVQKVKPDVILNCVGIVKQLKEAKNTGKSITVNSVLPHKLAELSEAYHFRFIHISTDCVFSGRKGGYDETDKPDPSDLYGWTKLLGEVSNGNVLTLRTSLIGRELNTEHGLVEWFLSQQGNSVKGYTKAIFSGFTTDTLSSILKDIILKHQGLKGLYHVSSKPISKYDLLMLIKYKAGLNIEVIPDDQFQCNRSLDSSKFRSETGYNPPSWDTMIDKLVEGIKKGAR
jgi:dTDP-4-dehydrorhamnose reductase